MVFVLLRLFPQVMSVPMMKRPWLNLVLSLPAAAALLLPVSALRAQDNPPRKIDVSKFKYKLEGSDVVIPVPSEIFNALDKLGGNPNWNSVLPGTSGKSPVVPAEIAMRLGMVIANGFVAVEAKEKDKVEQIGKDVIKLANSLSVGSSVTSHCNAIIEAAKNGEWIKVRSELDKAQSSVRDAMVKLRSQDNSELISIAGWLRGTDALTYLIKQDYKPESADLLHQPDMLNTFEAQFDHMDDKTKADPVVSELRAGLKKIKPLVETHGADAIPEKTVAEINGITAVLVKSIAP